MCLLTCVSKKTCHLFVFWNNYFKRGPISIIFGMRTLEETIHQKVVNCPPHLKYVTALPCEIPKNDFQVFWLFFNKTNTVSECSWNHNCFLIFSLIASSLWRHGSVWRKSESKNWWKRIGQVALSIRRRYWTNFQSMKLSSFFVRKTVQLRCKEIKKAVKIHRLSYL